jgi:hypothetical protein
VKTSNLIGAAIGIVLLAVAMFVTGRVSVPHSSPTTPGPNVTEIKEGRDAIDENLMVALNQAKNFHRKAKVYMSDGNLPAATVTVRQILTIQFPAAAAEADDVRNDARALLAKLLVSQGQLDEAMRVVDEGLAASSRESFFVANLHTVRGEIFEARAANLDAEGAEKSTSAAERRLAIDAYDKSIQINAKLQKQLMEKR